MAAAAAVSEEGYGVPCGACGHANLAGADTCVECGQSLVAGLEQDGESSVLEQPLLRLNPRTPECVDRDTVVREVISRLQGRHVGCVLVTGHGGELVGIFTERDVLYRVVGLIQDLAAVPVESLMTPRPTTLKAADPISRALHLMAVHGFRHIPLEDEDGCPVGVVSLRDIVRFMEDNFMPAAGEGE